MKLLKKFIKWSKDNKTCLYICPIIGATADLMEYVAEKVVEGEGKKGE